MLRFVVVPFMFFGLLGEGCALLPGAKDSSPAIELIAGNWERVSPIGGMMIEMGPDGTGRIALQQSRGEYMYSYADRAVFFGGDSAPQLSVKYSNGPVTVDTMTKIKLLTKTKMVLEYSSPTTFEEEYVRKD